MNLRLIKNNFTAVEPINLQNQFATSRSKFSSDFINYSKSLEELISYDCQKDPDGFYNKLELVRIKRDTVHTDIAKLNDYIEQYITSIKTIQIGNNDGEN